MRPGTVYKLYSKIMGEVIMNDHEAAEIRRLPLDSVVVELKNMMGDRPVVPVLEVFVSSRYQISNFFFSLSLCFVEFVLCYLYLVQLQFSQQIS